MPRSGAKAIDISVADDRASVTIAIRDDSGSKSVTVKPDGLQMLIRHLSDVEASLSRASDRPEADRADQRLGERRIIIPEETGQ